MIVKKEFLNKLKDFGLNTYESKLWTALLSRGISTAGELSDIAGVPRSRSYDVLESLAKKGFILMYYEFLPLSNGRGDFKVDRRRRI